MEKKNKNYFTRKNLIAISLVALYSFLTLFVGACIEGNHNFFVEDNPIALLAKGFKFSVIVCGGSGAIALVLVALYIIVGFVAILYIYRYAKVNNIKFRSPKIVLAIVLTVLFCLLLSIGIGVIIQRPLNASNIGTLFNFTPLTPSLLISAGTSTAIQLGKSSINPSFKIFTASST